MRTTFTIALVLALAGGSVAQVTLDVPLRLNGPASEQQVVGLGAPLNNTALVTLDGAVRTGWHWTTAQLLGNTISLTAAPAATVYRDGMLLRFLADANMDGNLLVSVDGLASLPLERPDGLPPVVGQIVQGSVCEVMYVAGHFVLLSAAERGCPPNTVAVTERFCIERSSVPNLLFFTASDRCAMRGGKLCTWDEYYAACVLVLPQLTGMFDQWEWMDDTSNHTQTVDQVGRTSCKSQRSAGVPATAIGDTRCCFHPR
ncbi:MAG: hypothetical protein IPI81_02950 [Flavobacteriales bacterium]|nr:hypothetical protein [Flavobacteriales bacterium]MCC6937027.1 hypothetical protein [Flavobacteriales bacterium]